MIIRDKTNKKIEQVKKKLGLVGDVYIIDNLIESLDSHKRIVPNSVASNIEQAEEERRIILNNVNI